MADDRFAGYFSELGGSEPPADVHGKPLTARQALILQLLAYGYDYAMVANHLGVSVSTVSKNLAEARVALAAKSTSHAVAIAWRQGAIQ